MKINTKSALLDFKGEVIKDSEDKSVISLGQIITNVLGASRKNPHRCYVLGKQIAENKEVDLKAEDIVFIKEVIAESTLTAIFAGQVIELLDNPEKTKK